MTPEQITQKLGRKILLPISLINLISMLCVIASLFFMIWGDFSYAFKIGLTGLLGLIFSGALYNFVKKTIKDAVEHQLKEGAENKSVKKSKFQERLEKIINENKN